MWLLVGGDSEIGAATHRLLRSRDIASTATTRRKNQVAADRPLLDLAAPLDRWEPPAGTRAAGIFAAVARLAACAADPVGSAYINVTQTLAVVERLVERGIYVVFLSTNQVFDGSVPNVPADAPMCPVSEYGRQKARIEATLGEYMKRGAPIAVLRLAKVLSPDMPLIQGWVHDLRKGKSIRVFDDVPMAPVPTDLATVVIAKLLNDRVSGIFQLTGPRDVSYAEVGYHLSDRLNADKSLVQAVSAKTAGMPEGFTPRYTTLDSRALLERYGLVVPEPLALINAVIERALANTLL